MNNEPSIEYPESVDGAADNNTYPPAGFSAPSPPIQVIGRCEDIFRLFTPTRLTIRLSDLEQELGMQRSTAHRYLTSLGATGFLERVEEGYAPGPLMTSIGTLALDSQRILDIADPYMRRLTSEIHETCVLSLWGGRGPVIVRVMEDMDKVVHVLVRIGATLDPNSAQGRVFLAFLHDDDLTERVLASLPKPTSDDVLKSLPDVYRNRLSISATLVRGVRTVAAPILDRRERIMAAIAVVGTMQSIPEGADSGLALAVSHTAKLLSEQLGWSNSNNL